MGSAIVIGFAPFVARMYSVADFGVYELYYSTGTILSMVSMLGYEKAVLLEPDDRGQINAMVFAAIGLLSTSLLLFLGLIVLHQTEAFPKLESIWVWAMPAFVMLSGAFNLISVYLTRTGTFSILAKIKLVSSVFIVVTQISFAWLGLGHVGLVLSNLTVQAFVSTILVLVFVRGNRESWRNFDLAEIQSLAIRNWRLPILYLPGNFLSALTNAIPAFFFARVDVVVLGYYSLARRIMGVPLGILSNTMQKLYLNAVTNEIATGGNMRSVFLRNLKYFSVVALALFLGLWLLTKDLIPLLFGSQWDQAPPFVILFGLEFCIKFVIGSLSAVMIFGKLPKFDIYWQVANLCWILSCVAICTSLNLTPYATVTAYVVASAMSYLSYGVTIYVLAGNTSYLKT